MPGVDCEGRCLQCGQPVESSGGCLRCTSSQTWILGADGNYVVQPRVYEDPLDAAIQRAGTDYQLAAWLRELKDWREGRLSSVTSRVV